MQTSKSIRTFLSSLVALSVTFSASSCGMTREEMIIRATQAALNASIASIMPITPQQEMMLGEEMKREIAKEFRVYSAHPALVQYVRSIGNKIVAKAKRKNEIDYEFYVLDTPMVNAFAIPGGAIFITTEALKYIHNEAELAGVLAHEVAHIDENHIAETIRRAMIAQGIAEGALRSGDSQIVKVLAQITFDLLLKGFSRSQELEADLAGTLIATDLSYAPEGLPGFLSTLLDLTGEDPRGIIRFLLTHPGSEERILAIRKFVAQNRLIPPNPILNEAAYIKQISVLPPKVKVKETSIR